MTSSRASVVAKLKSRVADNLCSTIVEKDAVALCIAAALPREREELLGFLLNDKLCRVAISCADTLSINSTEWKELFGKDRGAISESHAVSVLKESAFAERLDSLGNALRCSLDEHDLNAQWKRATSKLSCIVALHTDSVEDFVSYVLGGIVRGDVRRLDDVRCSVEEEDTDTLLLCKGILALAACVT